MKCFALAALALSPMLTETANAQAVTTSYSFIARFYPTARRFEGIFSIRNDAGQLSLAAFSGTFDGYTYDTLNTSIMPVTDPSGFTQTYIGGSVGGAGILASGDDFRFEYRSGFPAFGVLGSISSSGGFSGSGGFTYTELSTAVDAVPEPGTWAMLLVGFGMIGAASRYRRRITATTFA